MDSSPYVKKAEAMTMDIVELSKPIGNQNQGRLGNQCLNRRNMVMKGQDPINKCFFFFLINRFHHYYVVSLFALRCALKPLSPCIKKANLFTTQTSGGK